LFQTIEEAINGRSQQHIDRYTIDGRFSYRWRPGLTSTVLIGYNKVNWLDFRSQEPQPYALRDPTGVRDVTNGHRSLLTMDFNTSWEIMLSDRVGMEVWGGGQAFFEESASVRAATRDFPTVGLATLGGGSRTSALGESYAEVINAGLFSQVQFSFADRLFLTAGFRADGNSAFGEDLGLSLYPKVSGSYVISDESFWPDTGWNLLRLRAAFGQSGLQPGAFDAVETWNPVNRIGGQAGVIPGSVGNPLLKPERSTEFEAGFDLGRDRVGLEFTYYRQHTTDGIVNIPVSPTLGFLGSRTTNLAELETTGIEALLSVNLVEGPRYGWSITGTVGTVNETVIDIGRGDQTSYNLGGGRTQVWVAEGHPPGVVVSSVLDEDNPYDLTVPIGELTRLDQVRPNRLQNAAGQDSIVFFKGSTPSLNASLSTDVRLPRDLTVRAIFTGASGFSVSGDNMLNWYQSFTAPGQAERIAELDDPNTSTERRREIAEWQARHDPNIFGNWVVDGDYIRFHELSMHYGVPGTVAAKLGLSNMSVSVAAENLKLWTNSFYVGDPGQPLTDMNQEDAVQRTYQRHQLPSPRRFTVSVRGAW
jgi:TonB-dependent starch-binding outer membrane protein SusC